MRFKKKLLCAHSVFQPETGSGCSLVARDMYMWCLVP